MILKELLRLIETDDEFIPEITECQIYCIPNSIFKITLSPMCEEETWVTLSVYSPLLVPWYRCEISSITPVDDKTIQVWLRDREFLLENYKDDIRDMRITEVKEECQNE